MGKSFSSGTYWMGMWLRASFRRRRNDARSGADGIQVLAQKTESEIANRLCKYLVKNHKLAYTLKFIYQRTYKHLHIYGLHCFWDHDTKKVHIYLDSLGGSFLFGWWNKKGQTLLQEKKNLKLIIVLD